jgi:ubiquinone/menaquinone biosynthesis C-methylase UbiE
MTVTEAVATLEHVDDDHERCERFCRAGYNDSLVESWLPALEGAVEKLERGAHVADVGCGHGSSTILMARAFPRSSFVGSDSDEDSIATARSRAVYAGVADPLRFEAAQASAHPGRGYDLVTMFDCLHGVDESLRAARHVRDVLAPDGTWMIVEPANGAQRVALGAQARIRKVVEAVGFGRFRAVAETPFNLVFEARQ